MAILCIVPFLTLYQYEAVKQSTSEVCAVKVSFGGDTSITYDSKNCGNGSVVRPDADCQFSTSKVGRVEMLDRNGI